MLFALLLADIIKLQTKYVVFVLALFLFYSFFIVRTDAVICAQLVRLKKNVMQNVAGNFWQITPVSSSKSMPFFTLQMLVLETSSFFFFFLLRFFKQPLILFYWLDLFIKHHGITFNKTFSV